MPIVFAAACGKREAPIATAEMSRELTRDMRASEGELTSFQDSISRLLSDSVSGLLKRADTSWVEYRRRECDAIRGAFTQGSVAPVAQMECWVELTDDRSRFLRHEYNFAR